MDVTGTGAIAAAAGAGPAAAMGRAASAVPDAIRKNTVEPGSRGRTFSSNENFVDGTKLQTYRDVPVACRFTFDLMGRLAPVFRV